ncbi:uncharacterized protein [Eurosta solidaginis]|uniref:uncharacterized protein n=1 Tax=Eurosta solidaginis TaxID=178769 RepID=UPI00353171EC
MSKRCFLCDKKRDRFNNIGLHCFPKNAETCEKWLEACGLTTSDNLTNMRICSNHFQVNDFNPESSNIGRLMNGAFPSIDVCISSRNMRSSCEETSVHLPSDGAEEISTPVKKTPFSDPRFISEIKTSDVATPSRVSSVIALTTKSIKFKPATTKNMFVVQNGNLVQIPSKQGTVKPGVGTILATPTGSLQLQPSLGQLQYRPRPAPGTPKTQPPLRSPQTQPPHGQLPTLWNSSGMVANKEVTTQRPAAPLIDNDIDAQKTDTDEDGYSNIDFEDDDYQIIESDENIKACDPIWTSILSSPCNTFNYVGAVIPKLKQTAPYDPLLYFDMLIGSRAKFFRKLAISCSIRALNKIDLLPNFQSFAPEELQTFIGLCLQMSSLRLHNLDEYWDKNANYGFNGIEEKMSLNRFKMILEVLNFDYIQEETRTAADSSSRVNDKFAELRPLLNFFNSQMDLLYDCDRNLILNEPMLYWKGKFTWLNEVNTKFRCNAVLLHFLTEPSGVLLKIVPDLENVERKNVHRSSQEFVRQRLAIALEALQANMGKGDADADLYNPDWLEITPIPYGAEIFYSNESDPGLRKEISKPSTATGFFYKLLGGSRFFQRLAESCNKEVMKPMTDMPINEAIEEFNAKEMSIFIGICLQMGSMQLTTLSEYWECKAYYHVDGFANKICYQRFKTILEHLNFEDFQPDNLKTADSYEDKFMKLRPALYFFNKRMEFLYNCGKDLVLNDPIIYWKGRMNWLKDMKEKFRRNAVLIHLLSEPSGFVHKIYMDKESDERKLMAKNSKELVIERLSIATELLKEKLHRGHTVFVPKYYGSYALALELSKFDTYCSGFLELTRFGNSKQLVLHQLRQYKYEVRYANCIMMGKYNGLHNKNLYFYTSIPDYVYKNEFGIQNCLNMLKELAIKKKIPTELGTHMLSYQLALEHTEIKWDKRLMIYIIELMLQNAYILYNSDAKNGGSTNPNLISYQIFRQHIIASLLNPKFNWSNCNNEKDLVKTIATDQSISLAEKMLEENLQLLEMHKPKKLPPAEGKCMKKRCRMCNKTGFVAFSEVCCIICPGMPGLCQTPCFEIWHDRIQKRIMAGNYK